MQSFKLLGIYLDEHLTLNKHVAHVSAKLTRSLDLLNRVKIFVSLASLKKLYFSLFHSHLLYCSNIFGCTSQSNINKILVLQKKAIRIMTMSSYSAHTGPLFLSNNILPFDKLLSFNKLMFMHSVGYNYSPPAFDNTWMINAERNTGHHLRNQDIFTLPNVRIEQFRKFPLYALPLEWNNLSDNIRLQHNGTTFKIALFDHLLESIL